MALNVGVNSKSISLGQWVGYTFVPREPTGKESARKRTRDMRRKAFTSKLSTVPF